MKLVYYLPSLEAPGGLERIITFKANYFAGHGDDVTVITSEMMGRKPYFPLSPGVRHIDLGVAFDYPYSQPKAMKVLKYPFRYHRFRKRFAKALRELRPDITVSTLRRELNFLNDLDDGSVKIGEFHVTRHSYGAEAFESGNPLVRRAKRKWNETFIRNLSRLKRVVLLTHEEAGFWPELDNLSIIPNPIITPLNKVSDCTQKRVIAAGRYAPQKGFDRLIDSWAIVARKHPSWSLHIYGDGYLRTELQAQIDRLQLADTCHLEHTVENITDKYCESSIFVLSSRFEGFGMVITEAMGCGIPPVSFACPCGPRDIIHDGVDGLLVEDGNIEEMAEKIACLIENEDKRIEMGKQAYLDAQKYKMENIAKQWKQLFESITEKTNNL
ncbi:glycosyltransferase family 4 protein [Bacteroides sp.]